MARSSGKTQTAAAPSQIQLELLQSNYNPFWKSSLFNDVYLQNDVPEKFKDFWQHEESGPFYEFCNSFRNLCEELKGSDFESWSERNTINRFVKPVLKMLGYTGTLTQDPWAEDEPFTISENSELHTYKPDLILVHDPKELKYIEKEKGQRKLEEARQSVIIPVEAKYWGRIEDQESSQQEDKKRSDKKDQNESSRGMSFDEQCLKYMEILQKEFGILTDGRTWRLYHSELSKDTYKRNFQFNLGHLIRHVNAGLDSSGQSYELFVENAKYFFHIFSKQSLYSETGERPFLNDLLEYSKKYVATVEDDLKARFVKAMAIACNGFKRALNSQKADVDFEKIRNVSESHLFNILFIRYCESKGILPMKESGYRKISISATIDKLNYFNPKKEEDNLNYPYLKRAFTGHFTYSQQGTELYERLLKLTEIVQSGTRNSENGFEIRGFRESIFNKDEVQLIKSFKLNNSEMCSILYELGYCETKPGKHQQIPYNFFSPRQLGSIYESFLEFKLEHADRDMAFIKKQWVAADLGSERVASLGDIPKVKKGNLFFSPNNAERKATGSYYTPDVVVQHIVRETLAPIVFGKSSEQLLNITVCDPAMGSGHFISAALNFLARRYLVARDRELNTDNSVSLNEAKRQVLHNCIFGIDMNPRAVKLAKMSLWLESACPDQILENLEHQLITRNSLSDWKTDEVFKKGGVKIVARGLELKKDFPNLKRDGFDAIVGNPPWGAQLEETVIDIFKSRYKKSNYKLINTFKFFIERGLELIAKTGRLSYIVPSSLIAHIGCRDTRTLLIENGITMIADLGDGVFEGVCAPSCIFLVDRSQNPKSIKVGKKKNDSSDPLSLEWSSQNVGEITQRENVNFLESDESELSQADFVRLEEIAKVYDSGIDYSRKALGDAVFYKFVTENRKDSSKDISVWMGRDIEQFAVHAPSKVLRHNWQDIENKQKKADPKTRLKVNSKVYDVSPKIFVRQTGDSIIAAIDYTGRYHQKSLLTVVPNDPAMVEAICCTLNTVFVTEYYRSSVGEEGKAFAQVKKNKVEQLPMPRSFSEADLKFFKGIYAKLERDPANEAHRRELESFVMKVLKGKKSRVAA